eukprot:GEZU01032947.1.p2 GENE.GEZU01032947.1~~GEZU01032947.1.p2  ORF type:complete len:176 (+),score=74.73 GEZU01032947.1:468-995(+)
MSLTNWSPFDTDFGFGVDPWREFRRLEREMNRVFGRTGTELMPFSTDFGAGDRSLAVFTPHWDVSENDKSIMINCELPGLNKENINIDVDNDMLTISGEKKEERKEENERIHRVERRYGKFSRSLRLPKGVDPNSIQANFENGVLRVVVPKPAQAIENRKTIPIMDKSSSTTANK